MSNSVDKRVVQMQFDNAAFEKGVGQTVKSLDSLKKGLDLDGSSRSLSRLSNVAKNFTLNGISEGVSTVASRFTTLGIAGVQVINRITDAAINMGKEIFNSVSGLAAIKSGMEEYETQINAIQTILANTSAKGTTMTDVTDALGELNTYADKTIYNFTEMTRNIGTFTAAGVELDTSVSAIKGIANLAAVSGSTSLQASTGMYQLSQAISTGTVRLQDWNSVQNAGMGGELFQNALKETARIHGVEIDKIIEQEGSFRSSLAKEWLTKDVLLETLSKFTGDLGPAQLEAIGYTKDQITEIMKLGKMANDAATKVKTFTQLKDTIKEMAQSGWTKSWELIIGDFEQAKELFTGWSEAFGAIIDGSAAVRNKILTGWGELGGRVDLMKSLENVFNSLLEIARPIKEAMSDIFPPLTSKRLVDLTFNLRQFTKRLKPSASVLFNIKRLFKGLFSIIDIGVQFVSALRTGFKDLFGGLGDKAPLLLMYISRWANYITVLSDSIRETDAFGVAIGKAVDFIKNLKTKIEAFVVKAKAFGQKITEAFAPVGEMFREVFGSFKNIDTSGLDTFKEKLKARFKPMLKLGGIFQAVFQGIMGLVVKMMPTLTKFGTALSDGFGRFSEIMMESVENLEFNTIVDLFNTGLLGALLLGIRNFFSNGADAFEGVSDLLEGVGDSLEAWQLTLKANVLLKIAGAIGILALAIVALSMVDSNKMTVALVAITTMFGELMGSMALFDKIAGSTGFSSIAKIVIGLTGISVAILILSFAVKKMSELDWDELSRSMVGIAGIAAALVATSKLLSGNTSGMIKGAIGIIALSIGFNIMVRAVRKLSELEPDKLQQGLLGMGALFTELALFVKMVGEPKKLIATAGGVVILSGALMVMTLAVSNLGKLDAGEIQQGLIAVGLILTGLAAFITAVGNAKNVVAVAIGVAILAGATNLLALAIGTIGAMDAVDIQEGLAGIAAGLTILIAAIYAMPKDIIVKSAALVVLSSALVILANALTIMGGMSWDEIGRGLAALGGSLGLLALGLYLMSGTLPGAAALLAASIAIALLAPALKTLGEMSMENLGVALLALVAVFAVLGVAGYLLTPVIPTLLALAGVLFLFGLAALAVGLGVTLFAAGMTALAISATAGSAALAVYMTTMMGLLPMVVEQLGLALKAFLGVLIGTIPLLVELIGTLLLGIIEVIVMVIPPLVNAIGVLIMALLEKIVELVPVIVDTGWKIVLAILTGIRDNIGELITVAYDIVMEFIKAIAVKIPELVNTAAEMIVVFIDGLTIAVEEQLPRIIESVKNLGVAIIDGLVSGLTGGGVSSVTSAITGLAETALTTFKNVLGIESPSKEFKGAAVYSVEGFVNGIIDQTGGMAASMADMANTILEVLLSKIPDFEAAGMKVAEAISVGIQNGLSANVQSSTAIFEAVLSQFTQFEFRFVDAGKDNMDGFVSGMSDRLAAAKSAARNIASGARGVVAGYYGSFRSSGQSMANGFAYGINLNTWVAEQAAASMAQAAVDAANAQLDINSPSKVTEEMGKFTVMGFANGLMNYAILATRAAADLGGKVVSSMTSAINHISDAINSDMDMSPTIRPVVDLTDIQSGAKTLNQLLGFEKGLDLSVASNRLSSVNARMQKPATDVAENTPTQTDGALYNFTQINNSPAALSRIDIYRQTKNQLLQLKGLVNN